MGIGKVIKEGAEAVIHGATHSTRLRGLTHNVVKQFDDVKTRVKRLDSEGATVTTRGPNTKTTKWDAETHRPISERGHISKDFGSSKRGDNATEIGKMGNEGDDGGHLGGHRFFGDTPDEGIAPQIANLNRGAWKKMENEWADWANKGYHVHYNIDVSPPGAVRPDKFEVDYTVTNPHTGEIVHENWPMFRNVDGQDFDRVYPADMPDL